MSFLQRLGDTLKRFFQNLLNALARFMYGRNGFDQLCIGLVGLELLLSILSSFIKITLVSNIISLVTLVIWGYVIFRAFSKNLAKRRAENAKFLSWWYKVKGKVTGFISRSKDKDHKYFRCKCGAYCRVPKGVGKVRITCPKCHTEMVRKS